VKFYDIFNCKFGLPSTNAWRQRASTVRLCSYRCATKAVTINSVDAKFVGVICSSSENRFLGYLYW